MKNLTLLLATLLTYNLSFAQAFASNDKDPSLEVLPKNPEKINKVISDYGMKNVIKDKNVIPMNYTIGFYTRIYYQYGENSSAGKVGQKAGFALSGVSDATMQEITDVTYKYLIEKLTSIGYTFDDFSKAQASKKFAKAEEKKWTANGVELDGMNGVLPNKKEKLKYFNATGRDVYPPVTGPPYPYVAKDANAALLEANATIRFISVGHQVSSGAKSATYGIRTQPAISGNVGLAIMAPSFKSGVLGGVPTPTYRNEDLTVLTVDFDNSIDGYYVVNADEAKYKQAAITFIQDYFDLILGYMKGI